jgi:hypothetical protein
MPQKTRFISSSGESLDVEYDPDGDVIRIQGTPYAGGLFRMFGVLEVGTIFKIEQREADGCLWIHRLEQT